jgi:serine/threonine protein phosphatase PrpC
MGNSQNANAVQTKFIKLAVNKSVRATSISMYGKRDHNEDRKVFQMSLAPRYPNIIDGHGGHQASHALSFELVELLQSCNDTHDQKEISHVLVEWDTKDVAKDSMSGTTMVLALVEPNSKEDGSFLVSIANVGNSCCSLIQKDGTSKILTSDHNPNNSDKHKRILNVFHCVCENRIDRNLNIKKHY